MRYTGYNKTFHMMLARIDPKAASLTRDQFDLWDRGLTPEERDEEFFNACEEEISREKEFACSNARMGFRNDA